MRRRKFLAVVGGVIFIPLPVAAQASGKRRLIGWLGGSSKMASAGLISAFLKGMNELGYTENDDFIIAYKFAENHLDRLSTLARETVALRPEIILAAASSSAVAAKAATGTIPIVVPVLADQIQLGLVASDAHPGGNVTGITPFVEGLPGKQLELAREVIPGASIVGLLDDLSDPKIAVQRKEIEDIGRQLGVQIVSAECRSPDDLDGAFKVLAGAHVQALVVPHGSMLFGLRQRIALLAVTNKLPVIYAYREHVEAGGLISYGIDLRAAFHRAANYVHKIFSGEQPGELPVEFPTKLELVINLPAAKAISLVLPPMLVARADEVIE